MSDSTPIFLSEVFDSDDRELSAMRGRAFESLGAELYVPMMSAYFEGDTELLSELVRGADKIPDRTVEIESLRCCALLRLHLLKHTVSSDLLTRAKDLAAQSSIWSGEIHSLVAFAYELSGDHLSCRDSSDKAYRLLANAGIKRKAVRIFSNYIAAQSRITPSYNPIPDLLLLLEQAKCANEKKTAALAMIRLSREYQRLGDSNSAFAYASDAAALLEEFHDANSSIAAEPLGEGLEAFAAKIESLSANPDSLKLIAIRMRRDLESKNMYALHDLGPIIDLDCYGEKFFRSFSAERRGVVSGQRIIYRADSKNDVAVFSRQLSSDQRRIVVGIETWMMHLAAALFDTTPKDLQYSLIDFRIEPAGTAQTGVSQWHTDGNLLTMTLSLHGPGTEIFGPDLSIASDRELDGQLGSQILKPGIVGVFWGINCNSDLGHLPLFHRSPRADQDRIVIIMNVNKSISSWDKK